MKFLKIFYYVYLGFLILVVISLIISAIPITGNFKVLTVLSGSMEPTIKTGAVVVVKPLNDYKIGDIITFGTPGKTPTTHRIYDITVVGGKPIYITKGDANNAPDQKTVNKSEIIGKVLFKVPFLGYAVEVAKKPVGFAAIIIVPAVVIIGDEVIKIYKEIKKKSGN